MTGTDQVLKVDAFYNYPDRDDPYAKDDSTNEVPVTFWYPDDVSSQAALPLVVFSHGASGISSSNESLYRELASHGYVVCSISHPNQSLYTKLSNGKSIYVSPVFMEEMMSDRPDKRPEESVVHFEKWLGVRMRDMNFVLDTILKKAADNDQELAVYQLIDPQRIGLMGHSLGGSTVLGIARQRSDIKAVMALESPYLFDITGVNPDGKFTFDESPYEIPMLNVYSDATWSRLSETDLYAENARMLKEESADIQNVHIAGAGHLALTDLALASPFLGMMLDGMIYRQSPKEILTEVNEVSLRFFCEHLSKN